MSGLRMKVAGRFKPCEHMGCFDLEVFVEMNQRCRKWQCPICLKNYSLEKIIIDPFFNRITSKMRNCEDDMAEIEVKADGSWRVKAEGNHRGLGDLGLWHLPDGTLSVDGGSKPESELKLIKREGLPDSRAGLKLGMKKNQNGCWQFNKPDDTRSMLSANRLPENFRDNGQNIIPMNSSATGNGRDGEDACVIQDGGGNFNFSTNNAFLDAELIVLSDSEEENEPATTSRDVYKNNWTDTGGVSLPSAQHGIPNSYHGNPALGNAGSSCLGVLSSNDDDFGTHTWSLPSGSQGGPGFRLFDSDADVYGALNDMQYGFINCPKSISGYSLTAESAMGSAAVFSKSSVRCCKMNDGLTDNPLAFSSGDPSLQMLLPTRPLESLAQAELRDHPDVSNGICTEDWIPLKLGGGGRGGHGETAGANVLKSSQQSQSKNGALNSLADTGM
ncbi:E3 SUMO-protein ligase SIZ1-like isoform X2 [Olea europaea var. sylvestris]|uniref:E3 SUMO-protein ligase SIZ1-like isoform X2 n=1 Tax=Olea europaea var. sylvestris TaxID=158386 RepID=UPI000C1D3D20|nr:E3 SUMO-protein ligase SIZ1-like isoform X2 [Olea europaea var. sylvestris]